MDSTRLGRNLIVALALFAVIGLTVRFDLPLADRMERYLDYALTEEFDYRPWVEKVRGLDAYQSVVRLWSGLPWIGSAAPGPAANRPEMGAR